MEVLLGLGRLAGRGKAGVDRAAEGDEEEEEEEI